MTEERTILWKGKSGTEYKYWIYEIGTDFKAVAGKVVGQFQSEKILSSKRATIS